MLFAAVLLFTAAGCKKTRWNRVTATTIDFSAYDAVYTGRQSADGVLRYDDGTLSIAFSRCAEPEYIAVSPDSTRAWVSLQENNAIAVIDIPTAAISSVKGLGFKDFGAAGSGMDASDKGDAIAIMPRPHVYGMYQPDAVAAWRFNGTDYVFTANEGDDAWGNNERVKDLTLDPAVFTDVGLQDDDSLGRLVVLSLLGDAGGTGGYAGLYAYGGRSFAIWPADIGGPLFDSGDDFEQRIAASVGNDAAKFNLDNDEYDPSDADANSDKGGCDPEGITVGRVGEKVYAFTALEKQGGIMAYDVTDPAAPVFVAYASTRTFNADITREPDLGPEGLSLVEAASSPTGKALVLAAHEVSGTVIIYEVTEGSLDLIARYDSGEGFDEGGAEIVAFHASSKKMFITNGAAKALDVVDLKNLANTGSIQTLARSGRIRIADLAIADAAARSLTSCAAHPDEDYMAIAVPAAKSTDNGQVVFADLDGAVLKTVEVGPLPDMVAFSPDGRYCLTANEGEPDAAYPYFNPAVNVDPKGSITIITLKK